MSGELRTGQFRYTVTPDDDFVIGSPLNAGTRLSKYLTFQVSQNTGFGANPHIKCEYSTEHNRWELKFSNDGGTVSNFAYQDYANIFSETQTFNGSIMFDLAKAKMAGLAPLRVVVSDDTGTTMTYSTTTAQELGFLTGARSALQQQIDQKAPAGSDGRTLCLLDATTDRSYKIYIAKGALTIAPSYLPGTEFVVFRDVRTNLNYKLMVTNNKITLTSTPILGVYSLTLADHIADVYHKLYVENGSLIHMPE